MPQELATRPPPRLRFGISSGLCEFGNRAGSPIGKGNPYDGLAATYIMKLPKGVQHHDSGCAINPSSRAHTLG
jgi:hypothetical protein